MSRLSKQKCVCRLPLLNEFEALNGESDVIILSVEEYEVIRLIDYLGYSQEESALMMEAARTTITNLYQSARSKLSQFLIEGRKLKVQGGNYSLCPHHSCQNDCINCMKRCSKKNID